MIDLVRELRAQSLNRPHPKHYVSDLFANAADEIERLRGMLEANDINPDCEYIAKGGLRVNAPSSGVADNF